MEPKPQKPSFAAVSYSQLISLRHELEALFPGVLATQAEGGAHEKSNMLYVRLYRENNPIRDTTLVLIVTQDQCSILFSTIESVGNMGEAKLKLVAQIAHAIQRVGLKVVYDEAASYGLSEAERELIKRLMPESYRKKIEGLGIDWREAQ